ncbi:uncharacterized protein A4U43_C09F1440 [Asparagus officinalis]|uniref:Uncharacterized protein n=1 Tax=Asparagus officinalis TaxID=4686 RepID=A0A5P1E4P2_ASPOF|nr:WD repeat-containing protein YMR102C-like [Asparagus officinalis]ONK57530.1 uncharacterized protein A4U43_C09F1440 [Asparagus officinalis]
MQSFGAEEEEDVFFDSFDWTPVDSSPSGSTVDEEEEAGFGKLDSEIWKKDVMSVRERRKRFLVGMGLDEFVLSPLGGSSGSEECNQPLENKGLERLTESSGAVSNSLSSSCDDEGPKDSVCCIRDLDSGKKFVIHDLGQDGLFSMLKEVGSNKLISLQEFESVLGLSCFVQKFMRKEVAHPGEKVDAGLNGRIEKPKKWWKRYIPKRLLAGICKNDVSVKSSKLPRSIRAKVLRHKKKCLEFTALYMGQEIRAHKGAIRTMKFSTSGCYLASGGEDCVVRIWQVIEAEASCKCSIENGSCDFVDKIKDTKSMLGMKGIDAAPIVIPKKVFMIDEIPLQEFHGHTSDVLDLSWSNTDCLLTSSMDKTVRLWKVGCDGCLKVFHHNDYVTCVQFNPVDDEYFITGSIDGKVRIWGVTENHVVNWADIRDIVTSVCYRPDGEGFVVGSVTGNCRLYNYSGIGNTMRLESQFCIQGRKKSSGKPITGLQFSPEDSQRVMITSADSRVRIFDGVDVIHKFRGLRKSKSQLSASFTSDGRYIVSVGEDSNVYIWNYDLSGRQQSSKVTKSLKSLKSIRSCELFSSEGLSLAVPWPGINHRDSDSNNHHLHLPSQPAKILEPSTWLWDSDFCSLGAWLFADGISKGSATWPEEKLVASHRNSLEVRDHHHMHHRYQHLTHLSATWSLVIVTASCDGTIRSFHNYGLPVRL